MCINIDGDETVTLSSGERRARRAHRCRECGRTIAPGEVYQFWAVKDDSEFRTDKMCAHCWATITVGAAISGCPRNWWWGMVFDLTVECGFVGDIICNHDLTRRETAFMRLCAYRGKRSWTAPDGSLYPLPAAA